MTAIVYRPEMSAQFRSKRPMALYVVMMVSLSISCVVPARVFRTLFLLLTFTLISIACESCTYQCCSRSPLCVCGPSFFLRLSSIKRCFDHFELNKITLLPILIRHFKLNLFCQYFSFQKFALLKRIANNLKLITV